MHKRRLFRSVPLIGLLCACILPSHALAAHTQAQSRYVTLAHQRPAAGRRRSGLKPQIAAVLAGASRVQTFRLDPLSMLLLKPRPGSPQMTPPQMFGDYGEYSYPVVSVGPDEGRAFAARLADALLYEHERTQRGSVLLACFNPHLGFRVWHGVAYVDIFVCFECGQVVLIRPKPGSDDNAWENDLPLEQKRGLLLHRLGRKAFPGSQDI